MIELAPLGMLWGAGAWLHRTAYEIGILKQVKLPVRVVSVGNLTVGGTGKTPVVLALARALKSKGLRPGVVCRSYLAQTKNATKVTASEDGAALYGDEAWLYFTELKDLPVYCGLKKWQAAQLLADRESVDIILVDDGFQHHRLYRDFDLVLLDTTLEPKALHPMGWGSAREFAGVLKHADQILLTKTEVAAPASLAFWQGLAKQFCKDPISVEFEFRLRSVPAGKKLVLISGIGNPAHFEDAAAKKGYEVLEHLIFRDHYAYSQSDIAKITSQFPAETGFLTTAKDYVKLSQYPALAKQLAVLDVEVRINDEIVRKVIG